MSINSPVNFEENWFTCMNIEDTMVSVAVEVWPLHKNMRSITRKCLLSKALLLFKKTFISLEILVWNCCTRHIPLQYMYTQFVICLILSLHHLSSMNLFRKQNSGNLTLCKSCFLKHTVTFTIQMFLILTPFQIPDITMLFASIGKKRKPMSRHGQRIESGSIGEEEYETLYKQHFESIIPHEGKSKLSNVLQCCKTWNVSTH